MLGISGVKAIKSKLAKLEPKVRNKVVRTSLRKAAKVVQKSVKASVPRETGQTKRAVKVRAGKRSRKAISINVQIGKGDYKGDTFYASFPEYGTKYQPAQNNIKQAYQQSRDQAKRIALEELKKGIKEASK